MARDLQLLCESAGFGQVIETPQIIQTQVQAAAVIHLTVISGGREIENATLVRAMD
jgi:hypothetical protein